MKLRVLASVTCLSLLNIPAFAQLQPPKNCPLLGPVFSPSTNESSVALQSARTSFASKLAKAFTEGRLNNETISFSFSVYSASDNSTILSEHFASPGLNGSLPSGQLNDDTIYRVGSLTKLFTAYTLLAKSGFQDFDQPITKYVPELNDVPFEDAIDSVRWCDVTVGALASHMAGIPRDYALYDLSMLGDLGLPPLPPSSELTCGVTSLNEGYAPCNRTQSIAGLLSQKPITSTFNTPIYSNIGYVLISYVIESLTNQTFQEAIQNLLLNPLGLTRTSITTPQNETNVIEPFGPYSEFNQQFSTGAPAGAIYSTLTDLTALGRSILNSKLLSPALTRRWLKPFTHTSDPLASVGAPWEIVRFETPVASETNHTRFVDIYTKSGDVGNYSAFIGLDLDHGIGVSILVAGLGTSSARDVLASILVETFVPAAELAAREDAEQRYAGAYGINSDEFNVTLTLSVDDRPGLKFELEVNGADFRTFLAMIDGNAYANASLRLYPSGLSTGNKGGMTVIWDPTLTTLHTGIFETVCLSWSLVGALQYGGIGLDEWEVDFGEDGRVANVTSLGLRATLMRVS